jgi:hypothetical protein
MAGGARACPGHGCGLGRNRRNGPTWPAQPGWIVLDYCASPLRQAGSDAMSRQVPCDPPGVRARWTGEAE